MQFPTANNFLTGVLQTPRHNSPLNDKLMHNNRVHHLFKDQGMRYNGKHLVRSKGDENVTPRIHGVQTLSHLSEMRLDKLRKSAVIHKVVNHNRQSNLFITEPDDPSKKLDTDQSSRLNNSLECLEKNKQMILSARDSSSTIGSKLKTTNALTPREPYQSQAK